MKIELKRLDDAIHFEAKSETGNVVHMDAGENIGGHNKGVRPMQMLLMGLGGCSAIDIVIILKKQKQVIDDFEISIEGEREAGKEPSVWKTVVVLFKLKGKVDILVCLIQRKLKVVKQNLILKQLVILILREK